MMRRALVGVMLCACLTACASREPAPDAAGPLVVQAPPVQIRVVEPAAEPSVQPEPAPTPQPVTPAGWREVFPGVLVDVASKGVRFEGVVPIDAHDPNAPWVFLEVIVCTPDTKEHEALVMTQAKASSVHAALLLVGLEPGSPGRWKFENDRLVAVPPTGPGVDVRFTFRDAAGEERTVRPEEMVVNAHDRSRFGARRPGRWVFAGSQVINRGDEEFYDADGAGTLVGLTTFGSETVAWSEMISHEATVEEPAWIADAAVVPKVGTPVTVTIRAAE